MSIRLNSIRLNSIRCLNSIRVTAGFTAALALLASSAQAESVSKQCAARWQAAKAANQTGGDTYLQFYFKCSAEIKAQNAAPAAPAAPAPAAPVAPAATPVAPAAPAVAAPAAPAAPVTPGAARPLRPAARPAPAAPAASGAAVFPAAVNPAYANEKAGKAREKTCLDQYNANKASGGNGGLSGSRRAAATTASATRS